MPAQHNVLGEQGGKTGGRWGAEPGPMDDHEVFNFQIMLTRSKVMMSLACVAKLQFCGPALCPAACFALAARAASATEAGSSANEGPVVASPLTNVAARLTFPPEV